MDSHKNYKKAFTVVELVIVIVVIAILAAVTIIGYRGIQARARDVAAQKEIVDIYDRATVAVTIGGGDYDDVVNRLNQTALPPAESYYRGTSSLTDVSAQYPIVVSTDDTVLGITYEGKVYFVDTNGVVRSSMQGIWLLQPSGCGPGTVNVSDFAGSVAYAYDVQIKRWTTAPLLWSPC